MRALTLHGITFPLDALADLCRRYQVRELALFGSILRDDFGPDSDVDVLVEFEEDARIGLIAFIKLQNELADLLGREVDLVEKAGLKQRVRERVLPAAQQLYAA